MLAKTTFWPKPTTPDCSMLARTSPRRSLALDSMTTRIFRAFCGRSHRPRGVGHSRRWMQDSSCSAIPKPNRNVPFPSQQEYLDGQVPALAADATVKSRLDEHGWAFVFDVASVGKTTLALRVATSEEPRAHAAFYLDLAKVDDDSKNEASAALRRLTRPHTLLIIDNSHHQPELARQLWTEWKERPRESRLLMLGTRIHREAITHPAQDLVFLEKHATNPAVEVKPQPDDLGRLLSYLLIRVMPNRTPPRPPTEALRTWHQDYGSALGGFCFAVLNCIKGLFKANWELPTTAAAAWVRKVG